jgi:AcrR family transcriptional regulator
MLQDPFQPRAVIGRRGGRVKKPLDHDAIVEKALELLARDGLSGMSLRSVAKALDTGPASLYVYVADLQALHALVLDRALAGVSLRVARDKPWRERLEAVLASYYRVLFRHRGLAQLAMSTIAAGPNALRLIETLLGILDDGEIDEARAAWAVDLLMLYVTSIAFEQSQRAVDGDPLANVARAIGQVSASEHPRVHRARNALLSGEGSARFSWALHVLLEGILRVPTQTRRKAKTR